MAEPDGRDFLDRPAARWLAVLVIVLCGGLLGYLHRNDLGVAGSLDDIEEAESGSADPAAPCIAQRFVEIDTMVEEGLADAEQSALFKQRAEAMCRATTGDGSGPPAPLPAE